MRLSSLPGKWRQLTSAPPSLWAAFMKGWLRRKATGLVPCVVPGSHQLLWVPLADFYESYFFFCETIQGRREIGFFLDKLRPGEVFYDIGSFRGAYSAMAKLALEGRITVHAFEPLPGNFEAVRRIRDVNHFGEFTINKVAVADGTTIEGRINETVGMLRLGDAQAAASGTRLDAVSIDEYIARNNTPPTILKVDVDGFELQVLHGAMECLRTHHPRIWMEVHPGFLKAQGLNHETVLQFLREQGYTITHFDEAPSDAQPSYEIWCA